jgi:hypothetical protein
MASAEVDPGTARRTLRSLEAVHGMIYFTPDAPLEYAAAGVTDARSGYFASRCAAMGAVAPDMVIATFFNFHPGLVRQKMDRIWTITTPEKMLAARLRAVDSSLVRAFDQVLRCSAEFGRVLDLTRHAALVACEHMAGRPLFAAHAALPWPDEPHLALWHAQTLLREYRGDGHIAALTAEGLSGLDALISHAAVGDIPAEMLRRTRSWSVDEWADGVNSMVERGLLEPDGGFTHAGLAQREGLEATTDRVSLAPYAAIGNDACSEIRSLGRRLTELVLGAGLLHVRRITQYEDDDKRDERDGAAS